MSFPNFTLPAQAAAFIYPRTISVERQTARTGIGLQAYGGETESSMAVLFTAVSASIQYRSERGVPEARVPGDAPNRSGWWIFIPKAALAKGSITERDVIVDDLGKRYIVIAAHWDSLGYRCAAELLET